jgi:hypothetical protein
VDPEIPRNGVGLIFFRIKSRFHNNYFFFRKINTKAYFKAKITKHGKQKNDKDKIGNIILKYVIT